MGLCWKHHKKWFTETKLQRKLNRRQKALKKKIGFSASCKVEKQGITKQVKKVLLKIDVLDGFGFVKISNKAI